MCYIVNMWMFKYYFLKGCYSAPKGSLFMFFFFSFFQIISYLEIVVNGILLLIL